MVLTCCFSIFFNGTAPPQIYPLSLHDALPILGIVAGLPFEPRLIGAELLAVELARVKAVAECVLPDGKERSEEHTSELQSHSDLVCRLLLEKKKRQTWPERNKCLSRSNLATKQ